ncbi:MAG: RING finger domain-containing protein [Candidatus Caldarchaeales archaeon]
MEKRIRVGRPISGGFWDPWAVEEVRKSTPLPKLEAKRICVICLSEISEGASIIECPYCSAIGHENCFEDWVTLKGKCPLCRRAITL